MNSACPICLDSIKTKDECFLTCNHKFHFKCIRSLIFSGDTSIFFPCPMCRELNINMIKNTNDAYDYKTQLIGYLTQNNKLQR